MAAASGRGWAGRPRRRRTSAERPSGERLDARSGPVGLPAERAWQAVLPGVAQVRRRRPSGRRRRRLPRSSAAPVAPSPSSSMHEARRRRWRPVASHRQAVLAGEQHERRARGAATPERRARDGLSPNSVDRRRVADRQPELARPMLAPDAHLGERRPRGRRRTRPGSSRRGRGAMASRMNAWTRRSRAGRAPAGRPRRAAPASRA